MKRVSEHSKRGKYVFQGKVDLKGRKQGRGVEKQEDWEIWANFVNNKPHGKVELRFTDDQSYAYSTMIKGKLHGHYELYNAKGVKVFECEYVNGIKHGIGYEILKGECMIKGTWQNNEFEGKDNTFLYPDGTYIQGEWVEGMLMTGAYYTPGGKKIKNVKIDEVTREEMPEHKHDIDPYEKKTVIVKSAGKMGEGLYAKRDIWKGTLVSLYSGVLVPHYVVDRRRWEFNDNTIECDEKLSLDVPKPYHLTKNYSASLGHKANHSFEPNSLYTYLDHPKFGDIMSVIATKDIKKGEEILVNYGYSKHSHGPPWFRDAKKEFKDKQKRLSRKRKGMKVEFHSKRQKT